MNRKRKKMLDDHSRLNAERNYSLYQQAKNDPAYNQGWDEYNSSLPCEPNGHNDPDWNPNTVEEF